MSAAELTTLLGTYARSRIASDARVMDVWEEPRYGLWLAWVHSKDFGRFQLQARQSGDKWEISRYSGILKAT